MNNRKNNINPGSDFVGKVLGRTSGSPCQRACEQLPDLVDGQLKGLDRQLVQAHLEHCSGCRTVAVVLGWVGGELPQMAEVDAGPSFLAGVLVRTTGQVERPEVAGERMIPGSSRLLDNLRRWWGNGLLRPNFAMEVAYVMTVLAIMMVTLPGSPLKGGGDKALGMLQAGSPPLAYASLAFDEGQRWIENNFAISTGQIGVRMDESREKVQLDLAHRLERTAASRAAVKDGFAAVPPLIRAGNYGEAGSLGVQTLRALGFTWQLWWHDENRTSSIEQEG